MKKIFSVLMVAFFATALLSATAWGQTTLASWGFEGITVSSSAATSPSLTVGTTVADGGSLTSGSAFSALHASSSTVWSTPSGNGSSQSLSSNHWAAGDYFQFLFSTTNYTGISVTWDQTGSSGGPRDFKVQYSTDGSSFTDASGTNSTYSLIASTWTPGTTTTTGFRFTINLSAVSGLNNQSTVYIRLVSTSTTSIGGSTVGTAGTGRVDNFIVAAATALPVELTTFTAFATKNSIELAWNTATEVNNFGFEIQRTPSLSLPLTGGGLGGGGWTKIGFVPGNGTSNAPHSYSFVDNSVSFGAYSYRLKQIDHDGKFVYSKEAEATIAMAPNKVVLGQNYPNPFNPQTSIEFAVPATGYTTLKVYNTLGEEVATLVNGNVERGVLNRVSFNAGDFAGGLYFYTLRSGSFVETKKMLMVK